MLWRCRLFFWAGCIGLIRKGYVLRKASCLLGGFLFVVFDGLL